MKIGNTLLAVLLLLITGIGLNGGLASAANANTRVSAESVAPKPDEAAGTVAASTEEKEHGLPQNAVQIGHVFGLPITNSMVVTWLVALGLIVSTRVAMRKMKEVPD